MKCSVMVKVRRLRLCVEEQKCGVCCVCMHSYVLYSCVVILAQHTLFMLLNANLFQQ